MILSPEVLLPHVEDSVSVTAIKAARYTVLISLMFLGNAAVIVAKNRHAWNTTNYLIRNMAVPDLLLSALAVPRELRQIFIGFRRNGCSTVCSMQSFVKLFTLFKTFQPLHRYKTLWFLRLIARYTGVVSPFRKPFISLQRLKFAIALIWLISMGAYTRHFFIA